MEWSTVRVGGEGPVRSLVLNRPQVRNAIDTTLLGELIDACAWIERLTDCRVLLLRGAGPTFCAGADLKEGLTHDGTLADMLRRSRLGRQAVQALAELTPVTIAAVQGHAIGGGACLAAACDFRIGTKSARVSLREVSLGLSLSWNSIPNFVHLVGPSRAKEMILFGELYEAPALLAFGFFNEVAPDEGLDEAARRWADKVLRQPPLPVQMTKASINALVKALDRSIFHLDEYGLVLTGRSKDAARAKEAFFQDGRPDWGLE